MNKIIFYTFLIAISSTSFCQTKEETSNWLTKKINEHNHIEGRVINDNIFFIKSGNIFEKSYEKYFKTTTIFGIPIKSITKITVYSNENDYTFELYCGRNCINKNIDNIVGETENDTPKILRVEINKDDSTLLKRIPKALIHLIKAYGGNAKVIVNKEPF